jgi:L-threonylcarbamoyladenylate synthase
VQEPPNTSPQSSNIDWSRLIQHLDQGKCVAMPTETVYGLAARIDRPEGIKAIFNLKERPSFDPLIVHVSSFKQAREQVTEWLPLADFIARSFWPGPLTLVLPKASHISDLITSGLMTVGLRMPAHPLAKQLIESAATPLAAPSANRFGRISPTRASHVRDEFPEAIARGDILLLEGGDSEIGVESTVIAVTAQELCILRPGGVTQEELQLALKRWGQPVQIKVATHDERSPGHTEHHYQPQKPLIVMEVPEVERRLSPIPKSPRALNDLRYREWPHEVREQLLSLNGHGDSLAAIGQLPSEPALAARMLYSELRRLDETAEAQWLVIRLPKPEHGGGMWTAIEDRLRRASTAWVPMKMIPKP